jgi:hypothetical protein
MYAILIRSTSYFGSWVSIRTEHILPAMTYAAAIADISGC